MQINKTDSTDGFSLKSMYEKVKSLSEASAPLAQKLYEEESKKQASDNEESGPNDESDVVDADFEEVKEEKEQQNS